MPDTGSDTVFSSEDATEITLAGTVSETAQLSVALPMFMAYNSTKSITGNAHAQ
jgi:hypothetical protein